LLQICSISSKLSYINLLKIEKKRHFMRVSIQVCSYRYIVFELIVYFVKFQINNILAFKFFR